MPSNSAKQDNGAPRPRARWRERTRIVIFGTDTPLGKGFDVALLTAIVFSVFAVILESVGTLRMEYGPELRAAEWFFTGLFTIEYLARLASAPRPVRYAFSFFGVIDLLAIVPTYLSLLIPGSHSLLVIRAIRLLRVARVFKLAHFIGEIEFLTSAMRASRRKIIVFLAAVLILVTILGSTMYLIEGEEAGFTSIPRSIYWAIVTMTTVGYGDITPQSIPGQTLAAFVMIMGYAIIAVPTGIVTAEIVEAVRTKSVSTRTCTYCTSVGHEASARFCKDCGTEFGVEAEVD